MTELEEATMTIRRLLLAFNPSDPDYYQGVQDDAIDEAEAFLRKTEPVLAEASPTRFSSKRPDGF